MVATFPVMVIVALIFGRYVRKLSKEKQDELAKANVIVEETLQEAGIPFRADARKIPVEQ